MELESRSLSPNYRFPHPSPSFFNSFAVQLNFPEKMPEPEGESHGFFARASKGLDSHSLMDLDFDLELDPSWPLDQISFLSNPVSPIMVSSSDLPSSPLWVFSDDERLAGSSGAVAGLRISDCSGLGVGCNNPKSSRENPDENDDNRKLPSPVSGLRPSENPDAYCIIKERMTQALRYFKESTEQHVLAQVWAPVKNGNRYVLTTSGQPFVLGTLSNGLHQYRMASLRYMFSVDDENVNEGGLGLPGRVFRLKLPEWTPNVQYYSSKEFSRRSDALHHNVRGSLALPVFEPLGKSCVGVIELIMTSQKINYAPEVDKVCKALEAVNLKSSDILDHPNRQICNEGRQNALAEILEILTVVCETHNLPLAQTWVPCRHRSVLADGGGLMKSCSSFDGSCAGQVCMSTTDVAFYVVDAHMWGFWEACAEHHLQKGQGVAGRAFRSQNSCFCRDITKFCKTDYPLVHYARLFGLTGCFAICLRSAHTANDDYVLEFFLPPGVIDDFEQERLLASVLGTMKRHFQSLKLASGIELEEEGFFEIVEASTGDKTDSRTEVVSNSSKKQAVMNCDVAGNTNPEKRKKSERKRGKAEKTIGLDVLQQYFSGSLKDAAKSLGVCPTTMKRICRQHGISRWPSRKINKVNRSLTKLKRVIESVEGGEGTFGLGGEGTFGLTSRAASPLPVAVGSISWPSSFNGNAEIVNKLVFGADVLDHRDGHVLTQATLQQPELEETAGTPTSHGSCQGNPEIATAVPKDQSLDSTRDHHCGNPGESPELLGAFNVPAPYSIPLGGMLVEDAGSSKDLSNLCPNVAEERFPGNSCPKQPLNNTAAEERLPGNLCPKEPLNKMVEEERFPGNLCRKQPPNNSVAPPTDRKEEKTVTIKATYREDIIRFRITLSSGIVDLKEEVAKRLKLEVGTFDIKYLDDDLEWVLIACDADLQECADISRSSGRSVIRLLIHDSMASLGSSCESSGEY